VKQKPVRRVFGCKKCERANERAGPVKWYRGGCEESHEHADRDEQYGITAMHEERPKHRAYF
jgi:hypothetical protein